MKLGKFWHHHQWISRTHLRGWLHFGNTKCVGWEFLFWSKRFGISVRNDDEDTCFHAALPPLSFYLSLPCMFRSEGEFHVSVHDWSIWFSPWEHLWEWKRDDPWWRRGVSLNIPDLVFGRTQVETSVLRENIPVEIPMPEGSYRGTAKVECRIWRRPRWLPTARISTWIEVPKGIPHAGKGENSWDCGDDGVWATGCEGDDVQKAAEHFRDVVIRNRKRYGHASPEAVQAALVPA